MSLIFENDKIEYMAGQIEKLVYEWMEAKPEDIGVQSEYYCPTRDVFQAKLDRMLAEFLTSGSIGEAAYLISAIAGEIGNNSFDHNLGNWPDVTGIFFAYKFFGAEIKIILADRGRGILATLKKVKPELKDDADALKTAFTEKISGRAPENRGNGLKFVRENVEERKMHLSFISGNAKIELNEKMITGEMKENIKGCLAILSLKI